MNSSDADGNGRAEAIYGGVAEGGRKGGARSLFDFMSVRQCKIHRRPQVSNLIPCFS